jgi:proton-translocating NADH-quinone oxidoreductase chain L
MYLIPIFFTFISFFVVFFCGRYSNNYYISFFASILIFFSFFISIFIFYEVSLCHSPTYIYCGNWITTNLLEIQWTFSFDSLTSIMLIVILSISTCAHFYSIEYMLYDPHQIKFMSYLSLFTFFMLLLVTSSNFIILFLGWEGVGICSYLLINFWHTRTAANKSAIMAMFVNKIGDISLLVAFSLLFFLFYNFDFSILFLAVQTTMYPGLNEFNNYTTYVLYFICFFFIIGAVGKSAQLGLHTWLPEAMEGPTPVSSLIHAATMVTAGIFLVIRSNLFFQWCNDIFIIIVALGSLTAFVGSTIGIFQSDIKKIIAYSTCSQLGYMFLACGLNGYQFSIYHLTNHAFFKALLFLVAGYIIHAINNEQDIRQLGGLLYVLPFAYTGIMIGSLSLLGFPFFSGFFSKEKIIELFYSFLITQMNQVININLLFFFQLLASIAVTFTVLYSLKIIVTTFYYTFQNNPFKLITIHYSSILTILPLFLLSILSIISGYFLEDIMVGVSSNLWNFAILFQPTFEIFNLNDFEFNILSSKLPILSILFFLGLFFIYYYCFEKFLFYLKINFIFTEIFYQFLNKKYIVLNKNIYYPLIDFFFKFSYNSMYKLFDKGIIEIFGPFGIVKLINQTILFNSKINSGLIYHYFGIIVLSFLILVVLLFSLII